jgi:hypothetical protein
MAGLVPAIHAFLAAPAKTWMPGTSPGTTSCVGSQFFPPQIAFSEAHSSGVNSGGPLGG